jgi:hypothetical protein
MYKKNNTSIIKKGKKKAPTTFVIEAYKKLAATYSPTRRSTIGASSLNFSVRNGKRWNPAAIAT